MLVRLEFHNALVGVLIPVIISSLEVGQRVCLYDSENAKISSVNRKVEDSDVNSLILEGAVVPHHIGVNEMGRASIGGHSIVDDHHSQQGYNHFFI